MALRNFLRLWDTFVGDVNLNAVQAAAIGSSFGNGALSFIPAPIPAGANNLQMGEDGNLNVQISSAGLSPPTTATDIVLAVYSLPATALAQALDQANRGLALQASGSTVANTNTKTLKLIWGATTAVVGSTVTGGTTIASLILNSVAGGGGWNIQANVYKYGANGSNTQIALHEAGQGGNVVASLIAPSLLTAPENANILIAVTGNAATTNTDILFNFLQIFAMN